MYAIRSYYEQVDLIIDGGYRGEEPTTVIDFSEDEPTVLRVGAGDPSPLQYARLPRPAATTHFRPHRPSAMRPTFRNSYNFV